MLNIYPFCEEYGFDSAAISHFVAQHQALLSHADAYSIFCQQVAAYHSNHMLNHSPVFEQLHALQEITGIHKYTIDMLYILHLLPSLAEQYHQEGIKKQYFDSFVDNLKHTAWGCKKTHGVWGTDIAWWLIDFFKLKLFSIGRLQYKRRKFQKDIGGYPQGTYYIDVHVPSGAPLTKELCAASYAEATEFFRERYDMEDILFGCHSWLLSPDLEAILPPQSNILAFAHDYTILETRIDPTSSAVSFIFQVPSVPEDIESLPETTSLQKAIKQHLKSGKTLNTAFGIMECK